MLVVVVVAACCRERKRERKRERSNWKRSGCLLPWLCGGWRGGDEATAAEHRQRRTQESAELADNAELYQREVIPLRAADILDNPIYFSQTDAAQINTTTGDRLEIEMNPLRLRMSYKATKPGTFFNSMHGLILIVMLVWSKEGTLTQLL